MKKIAVIFILSVLGVSLFAADKNTKTRLAFCVPCGYNYKRRDGKERLPTAVQAVLCQDVQGGTHHSLQ